MQVSFYLVCFQTNQQNETQHQITFLSFYKKQEQQALYSGGNCLPFCIYTIKRLFYISS
jgi:hypothetical protein